MDTSPGIQAYYPVSVRPHQEFAAVFLQIPVTGDTLDFGYGVPVSGSPQD